MPAFRCPQCSREIHVTRDEVVAGIEIECAGCDRRFRVAAAPTGRRDPQPAVDEESVGTDEAAFQPPQQGRSSLIPILLVGGGLLFLLCCGVGGLLIATGDGGSHPTRQPVRFQPRGSPSFDPSPPDVGATGVALGIGFLLWGLLCGGFIAYFALVVLLLARVARDARARSVDGGAV